ncbi:lipase chaperone [Duganella sp. FT80W]|uniref:Lipase helper protein n=1 Tax=Duganella guangzhouensis TaxID=2666084 RepID=A0A6I2LA77_9BURK|nr:lipase secretion chaperone [Duganella guangzhouensis]MRW93646.1 lipase chaperone [Duganella guangzhouensis]
MPRARLYALAVLAAAVAGGVLLWPAQQPATAAPAATAAAPDYFAFVPSMLGTQPDGGARADASERLVVNTELAYLFDYYLAGLGEQSLAAIRAEIVRELERRLPAGAAAEARRLLDAYLAYKGALATLEQGLPAGATPAERARQRLTAMQRLRKNYFSDTEVAALFSASDAYDLDAIARLDIAANTALSDARRQQQLSALDAALPAAARADRDAPTSVIRLEDAVARARAAGTDDNEIYRMRAAALSPSAAARLAEVDREEADWQRRIGAYQAQRRQLLQSAPNEAALQQLREAGFNPSEQKRLPAYE